jgi:hypothetical protein
VEEIMVWAAGGRLSTRALVEGYEDLRRIVVVLAIYGFLADQAAGRALGR